MLIRTFLMAIAGLVPCCLAKFEPYALHGGLVSAIAGQDYFIIAADTRLSDGGYNILTRNHLSSRMYAANECGISGVFEGDGSVKIPDADESTEQMEKICATKCPTFIASSGCSSDCEALKRQIRSELNSHQNWNYGDNSLTPTGVANLLGHILYSRRSFPFYSFCIVAGLEEAGHGHVHIYDAIGSHERVSVACTGNGKEMLQPTLDRLFSTKIDDSKDTEDVQVQRDGRAVTAAKQRIGLKLQPPVETYVKCDSERAMSLLLRGYRSVAEREISVGDNVVIVCVKRNSSDNGFEVKAMKYPLKKH
ncbi:hypothetical protein CTEN210_09419 [Chaetoceros tenuissimus]|uniref:Proteasome subunit beta n=1 Tax=Chaetoceros tenuissimus TaxID=426638 RepID=A0AAD3CVJ3_9STRA|nr:hypothetical protein CTEN210_09419 [Chaetoceros tenuissimus]